MRLLAALLLLFTASPAFAQQAAEKAPRVWLANVSGGVFVHDGETAQPFGSIALSRRVGTGYIRLSLSHYESAARQVDATLPSTFTLASVSGGRSFGAWFVDAYASYGRQHYGLVTTALGQRRSQVGSGSPTLGAGLIAGRSMELGGDWVLTPSLTIQYGQARVLRQAFVGFVPLDYETREHGFSGSGALRLDRRFGQDGASSAGFSVTRSVVTSGAAGTLGPFAFSNHARDGWTDIGLQGSLALSRRLWLDLRTSRSIGISDGDASVASTGLRILF